MSPLDSVSDRQKESNVMSRNNVDYAGRGRRIVDLMFSYHLQAVSPQPGKQP
jgi:hypothetical protein